MKGLEHRAIYRFMAPLLFNLLSIARDRCPDHANLTAVSSRKAYTASAPDHIGFTRRVQLVKAPNFKQEKKQREMAQKKKNEQKQQEKAARKGVNPDPQRP